ncbi:Peptidase S11, D-alanyl-D-alanine carboxypeptidase A, N-terminal [Rhabdaerophilaceae bacterium]
MHTDALILFRRYPGGIKSLNLFRSDLPAVLPAPPPSGSIDDPLVQGSYCPMVIADFRAFSRAVVVLVLGAMHAAAPATANPMVPTLVVDADSGEVIDANHATRPWHPASTTKLMTAYVALRAVKTGAISLDTPIVVSAMAARQPPSKIGVRPGQEITLENALKILMVKSANDIAVVVAEGIGGTVPNFAQMMNQEARRIGMRESHWTNPHGWEDARQYTSARDLAVLSRALLSEFPEAGDLWGIGAIKLGSRVFNNTNGLMGRYSGAMGMKTGFICASGFNLVAAAQRNGRTLIAVVLGASNGADRSLKAAQLLDMGFSNSGGWGSGGGRTLAGLTSSIETGAPNRRADICRRGAPPASEVEDTGGSIVQESFDRPSSLVALQRSPSESMAVGVRAGNSIQLGPRSSLEPHFVYLGRKPGSTEVARRPGLPHSAPDAQATAFAPTQPAARSAGLPRAAGQPLVLPGAITAPGPVQGTTRAVAARPSAQAAIALKAKQPPVSAKARQNKAEQKKVASPKAKPASQAKKKDAKKTPPARLSEADRAQPPKAAAARP